MRPSLRFTNKTQATNSSMSFFQNKIERIENLEFLMNLKFLTLSHNLITKIEGLAMLKKLGFLDLSHNVIEEIAIGKCSYINKSTNDIFRTSVYRVHKAQVINITVQYVLDELPKSVVILNMTGNLCTQLPEYP